MRQKKDIALENATPDFRKPSVIGIVEQEQNGVSVPKTAANRAVSPKNSLHQLFGNIDVQNADPQTDDDEDDEEFCGDNQKNSPADSMVSVRLMGMYPPLRPGFQKQF